MCSGKPCSTNMGCRLPGHRVSFSNQARIEGFKLRLQSVVKVNCILTSFENYWNNFIIHYLIPSRLRNTRNGLEWDAAGAPVNTVSIYWVHTVYIYLVESTGVNVFFEKNTRPRQKTNTKNNTFFFIFVFLRSGVARQRLQLHFETKMEKNWEKKFEFYFSGSGTYWSIYLQWFLF